jgi:hypothetical protein
VIWARRGKEIHRFSQALELPSPALGEIQIGASDEILDCSGDQAFPGGRLRDDARRNVHGHPMHFGFLQLDLARVDAGADFHLERADRRDHR